MGAFSVVMVKLYFPVGREPLEMEVVRLSLLMVLKPFVREVTSFTSLEGPAAMAILTGWMEGGVSERTGRRASGWVERGRN